MTIVSSVYLLIFLPLIAAVFCQTIPLKKNYFWFVFACCFAIFLLSLTFLPQVLERKKIVNDFNLSILSLGLEFSLDLVGYFFLLLMIFAKITILFFYRLDVEKFLDEKSARNFYSVFLLNIFALINIFLTNNIFNLFVFLEIYIFTFFAISTLSRDSKLLKISFRDFCLNSASSLLILFCFLITYLLSKKLNFEEMSWLFNSTNMLLSCTMLSFLTVAFLTKFFPFWLLFDKIKNNNLVTNFLIAESVFIKATVGIFLMLKFIYFFFGKTFIFSTVSLQYPLMFLAVCLVVLSAIGIYRQKHLQSICIYLCLNNIAFILAAIALNSEDSLQSILFYLFNYNLVNFFIFILATLLKRRFGSASMIRLSLLRREGVIFVLPIKLLILFVAAFPLTPLFFANWNMAYSGLNLGFSSIVLFGLILANFSYADLALRFADAFFSDDEEEKTSSPGLTKYKYYFLSLWVLILSALLLVLFSEMLRVISKNFATYLLAI